MVGNPPGFPEGSKLAEIDKLALTVDAPAYLYNRSLVLLGIEIDHPVVEATQLPDGRSNWSFGSSGASASGGTSPLPTIGDLRINDGHVHAVIPRLKADFTLDVSTQERDKSKQGREDAKILVDARGSYAAEPITGQFVGGTLLSLRQKDQPYPVDLHLENGPTKVALTGTLEDPLALTGANLKLDLNGPSLDRLTPLSGVALPETPPFHLAGSIDYDHGLIRLQHIDGHVGHSDDEGEVGFDPGGERPHVSATLASQKVDLTDFAAVVGGVPGNPSMPGLTPEQRAEAKKAKASRRFLPDTPISVPKLRFADVDLHYKGERILGRYMPIDNLVAEVTVKDGTVTLHPLSLGVGAGRIEANVALDPRNDKQLHAVATVDFRKVDLSRLMAATHAFGGVGTIAGRAVIEGSGRSVGDILGNGNGDLKLFMTGGDLSAVLVDLSGLQFGNSLLSALGLPRRTPIRCLVTDFELKHGIVDTRMLVLDTKEANLTGSGTVNLKDEALDLQLKTEAKHFSIGSLPGPINITGHLKTPTIRPGAEAAARGALAAGLGALLTPLGALLPTIQLGLGKDNDCASLTSQAQRSPNPTTSERVRK